VLAGIVPTPTALMLTRQLRARGGIAITASHNPSPWNALKFIERDGLFLSATRAQELFDVYHQQDFPLVQESDIPEVAIQSNPTEGHFKRVLEYVDKEPIRKKRFKVAIDCCNGVGALYTVPFLEELLNCKVFPVLDKPSGIFEREPEPLPENIRLLCETVVREKCAVGFAQDPDGDRLAIVDEKGQPIGEDLTLAFAVQQVLSHHAQGPVAINLTTSKSVDYVARQHGSEVVRTKIGEIHVCEAMLRIGAVVGGENIGGVMIPAVHPCRDSYVGMAIVLELLAMTGKTISDLCAAIPRYFVMKEKIRIRGEQAPIILRALRREYAARKINLLDGIYIDFGESWVHARRSNTEPVIRITAEAATQDEARRLTADICSKIQKII
jgi:phosphomannomutase